MAIAEIVRASPPLPPNPPKDMAGGSPEDSGPLSETFSYYLTPTRLSEKPVKSSESSGPLAIDIDDTVLRHRRKPVYTDCESVLEACLPIQAACDRARSLIEAGHEVHFITGRSKVVLRPTLAQLKTWISTRILAEHIHCNGVWAGYDALQEHKAERLRALGAVLMIGDHAADEAAAMDAGIPFLHADAFAAGAPLPLEPLTPLLSVN